MTSKFLISLTIFSAIIALILFFIEPRLPGRLYYPSFWIIQLIMITATVLFHYGLTRSAAAGGQSFVRFFMGATSVKLFVFMMIMVLYGLLNKEQAFAFILHFFIFYILYTVYEVALAYRQFGDVRKKL